MKAPFLFSLLVCLASVNSLKYIPQHCQMVSPKTPCVCKDEYGNFVDLRPLAWRNFTARYQDHAPADGDNNHVYSWNPCYGFLEKSTNDTSGCMNVASCRVNKLKTEFLDIGIQNGASFGHFDNGNLSLTYKSQDGKRTTTVSLYCNEEQEDSTLRAVGDMGSFFWLQLRSKYCCPRKREEIPNFSRLGHLLNLIKNRTEEPHPPTIPTPSVVTVTSPPAPDLHQITFLLTGILIVSFLILLILVGGLFWKCIRRNPYAPYSLLPSDDFVENKRQTY